MKYPGSRSTAGLSRRHVTTKDLSAPHGCPCETVGHVGRWGLLITQ